MSYNSAHTGPEIDAAVQLLGQIQDARNSTSQDRVAVKDLATQVKIDAGQVSAQTEIVTTKASQVSSSATAVEQARSEVEGATAIAQEAKDAAAASAASAHESHSAASVSEQAAAESQLAAGLSEQVSAERAAEATTAAEQVAVDRATAAASAASAAASAQNAEAVVTGGTASVTPGPGLIPLADAQGKIDADWVPEGIARTEELQAVADTADGAADNAAEARSRTSSFLLPSPEAPNLRDDGKPLQAGDRYFNTVEQAEYLFNSEEWVLNDSLQAVGRLEPKVEELEVEQIKPLANYSALKNYKGPATSVRITQFGIAGQFNVLPGSSLTEVEGMIFVDPLGRVWMREYYGDIFDSWLGVKVNDPTPEVALSNAQAINRGLDFIGQVFPGILTLSSGIVFLDNTNPSAVNWDNRRAIYSRFSAVKMKGKGRGKTVLKLIPGANCHVIKIGSRVEEQVMVIGCEITDLEIDGNRLNQLIPGETENHSNGIDVSTGCWGTRLERLYIHDAMYYGVGFQRDQFRDCAVIDVEVERTGGDALDWKDDSDSGTGNVVRRFRAKSFGLSPQVLTEQAGLDLRSGVSAEEIDISDMIGVSGLIAIRMQNGTPGATPVQASSVDRFRVQGSNASNSSGLRVISRYAQARRGYVKGCSNGYNLTNPDARFSDLIAELNNVGFRLWQDTAAGVEADTACLVAPIARSNTQAGIVYDSVDEVTVLGGDIRNNGIGHDIRAGSTNVRVIGGSCSGNTTQLLDNGEGTVVLSVSGLRTRQVVSASVPIGSTGTKGISVPHGLGVTPNKKDVQLSLERDTNVGDWDPGFLWVAAVGPAFIDIQLRVITASATSTATVIVNAAINAKSIM